MDAQQALVQETPALMRQIALMQLYTVVTYVNPRAWTDLRIHDAEQFIDRFCIIANRPVVTVGMAIETRSAMVGFKNLIDLRAILTRLLKMRSAEEMAALGRLKKPRARQELVRVDLDDLQREKTGKHADGCGHIVFLEPLAAQVWLRAARQDRPAQRAKRQECIRSPTARARF